jgi:hypothetical protein
MRCRWGCTGCSMCKLLHLAFKNCAFCLYLKPGTLAVQVRQHLRLLACMHACWQRCALCVHSCAIT